MAKKKFSVSVETQALRKLEMHTEFLARVSEGAARRLYLAYEKAIAFLRETPESCPPYPSETPTNMELRYKLFGERYRLVFTIDGQMVYIYDIQDCRQDSDKNLSPY